MRAKIVKIGNSQGIRIPKPLLEQTGIMEDVELEVEENKIVIHAVSEPRSGWEDAFRSMAKNKEDSSVESFENIDHPWDQTEWQW